jgi:hypothetical protein
MKRNKGRITVFLAIAAFLFAAAPAAAFTPAPQFAASELMRMCSSTYDTDYGFCAGYVGAIANLMLTETVAQQRACNLENVRSQQQIDLFRGYMEIFPESGGGEAVSAVASAFARAFPCRG